MAKFEGIKPKDSEQLIAPKPFYSSYGRDNKDFVHFYVYDEDGNQIDDEILSAGELLFQDDSTIDLDIGTHLRQLGYKEGRYKVKYLFLRRVAGKKKTVFLNENGFVHNGRIATRVINGKTRYFTQNVFGGKQEKVEPTELFPKELKYFIKQISPNKRELKVDVQEIKNVPYKKNFASMNKNMVYIPLKRGGGGTIRWDLTDPNILVFNDAPGERGFTDAMVGGEITIKEMFEYSLTSTTKRTEKRLVKKALQAQKKLSDPKKTIENIPGPEEEWEDDREEDSYGSVCFTGDTKIKLSNNRSLPIKMMKPGMKVKTEQGYAKVLKVVKDNRPYGDKLVRYKNLITTDHHPIKHQGKWYMANEIGNEFVSKALDVWNLVLDKHHTIIANNVTSATLGKWNSINHFLDMRNKRINMIRPLSEVFFEDGSGQAGESDAGTGGTYSTNLGQSNQYEPLNEFITDTKLPTYDIDTIKRIENEEEVDEIIGEYDGEWVEEDFEVEVRTTTQVPVDFKARIIEVLDYNRIKVDKTYESAANESEHSGEDSSRKIFDEFFVNYTKHQVTRLNTYLVTDKKYNLIINSFDSPKAHDEELPLKDITDKTARYFKLYDKLDDDIEVNDLVYFVEEKMEPYEDTIELVPFIEEKEEVLYLRVPNLNSVDNPINFRGTQYRTHNDLIGTDSTTQQDIKNQVLSGSLLDVQVNVDYAKRTDTLGEEVTDFGFGNYIHFGSAEQRVRNFRDKVELIEYYTSESFALTNVTSSATSMNNFDVKKEQVINSFDPYEHYLYYDSGSYVSSSVGEWYQATWPKENSTSPYTLAHTSGSTSTTWYNNVVTSASLFDDNNTNRLVNNLPLHVNTDTQNNVFLEFVDMVGQQFDEIWTYLRHFTDMNEHSNKLSEGISKDIVREVAKSLGMDVTNGNDLIILPEYLVGKTSAGADKYESPQEEVTEEIWKRLLANLPFFLKNKGNTRAIKGLLNCYGVPSSILRVREYGGPDLNERVSYEIKRKFTYALDFKSKEYVESQWQNDSTSGIKPETIEFRFRSPKSQDQVIVQKGNEFAIQLQDNGATDNKGYLRFSVSASTGVQYITSSEQPFYNDDMWSVMLTRKSASGVDLTSDSITQNVTYELTTRQYDSTRNRVVYSTSESLDSGVAAAGNALNAAYTSSGFVYLGGNGSNFGTQFSGSLMEFRLWSEPLSQSIFENHLRAPKAYNGNTSSSHYDNLVLRIPLDNNVTYATTSSLTNIAHPQTYAYSGSTQQFGGNNYRSLVDVEEMRIPNIGPSRRNATKIRIENTSLDGQLAYNVRREKSSQDTAPVDSNKLGVYFSPADVINEDIMYSIADMNFDDYIGDPRDQYKYQYRGLEQQQRNYFKKYNSPNNFWDYMRLIDYFDNSIWTQIERLIPARANTNLGLLIEPNILERNKEVVGKLPEFENTYYENAGHYDYGLKMTNFISGSDDRTIIPSGEFPMYNGEVNIHNLESGSLGTLGLPTLVRLEEIDYISPYGSLYATASITLGGTTTEFEEATQPFVSSSRISEHNEIKLKYYTSSLSVSDANGYGIHTQYGGNYQFSSSFEPAEYQSMAYESKLFRLFYKQTLLTKENTIDGKEPVEVTITSPTRLVTKEPGDSKLIVE